ncbi:unnamed protein product [Porites lobata]|uniref:Ig-like domain-containing protein n=1 Tax=Porites lobata TaxID=104759 RepID=A0ABN8REB9_9CNID|nr:unnamed protein product [Porites lobata]
MNNITDWSTKKSISSPQVPVEAYFNVTLECEVGVRPSDCWDSSLRWYFINNSRKLESGEKYDIQERKTDTKCKTDFILTIVNVTETDEGKYKCQWLCEEDYPSFSRSSIIQLKVYSPSEKGTVTPRTSSAETFQSSQEATGKMSSPGVPTNHTSWDVSPLPTIFADSSTPSSQKTTSSTSTVWVSNFFLVAATGQGNSKSADKWIPAIAILTAGLALFFILFTTYHFISKKFGTGYRACKRKMTSNYLSSKGNH